MILIDTSGLLAAIDASQHQHEAAARVLREAEPPLLLSPFVLAELNYLLATRVSTATQMALLREVAAGAYQLEAFDRDDVAAAVELLEKYPDLGLGLADASIVILGDRHGADDVLTLDERHFRTLRRSKKRPFRVLPADA